MGTQQEDSVLTKIAKQLVRAFTRFIDERVEEEDPRYLKLGVDSSFEKYSTFFKEVITKVLGVNEIKTTAHLLVNECVLFLINVIQAQGYEKHLDNQKNALVVHEVCMYVIEKVREDKFTPPTQEELILATPQWMLN